MVYGVFSLLRTNKIVTQIDQLRNSPSILLRISSFLNLLRHSDCHWDPQRFLCYIRSTAPSLNCSKETQLLPVSPENSVEWRFSQCVLNCLAAHRICPFHLSSFQGYPNCYLCILKPHRPTPRSSLTGAPITTASSASLSASRPIIKLLLMHHPVALHCLQRIWSNLPGHLTIAPFCI